MKIEFRAWDKEVMKMDNNPIVLDIWQREPINDQFKLESEEKLIWMQYTNLNDKNGVKIFDGDRCWNDYEEEYGIVSFDEGKFIFTFDNVYVDLFEVVDDLEVVGNIHDNPELLEVSE